MPRYLIQSAETFMFLHSSPVTGHIAWTQSLLTAIRHGVCADVEEVAQLVEDHCDRALVVVVDLDEGRA